MATPESSKSDTTNVREQDNAKEHLGGTGEKINGRENLAESNLVNASLAQVTRVQVAPVNSKNTENDVDYFEEKKLSQTPLIIEDDKDLKSNGSSNDKAPQVMSKYIQFDVDVNEKEKKEDTEEENDKEKKKEEPLPTVGFFQLFRFADNLDILVMIIGTIAAILHGAALPLQIVIFGDVTDSFVDYGSGVGNDNLTADEIRKIEEQIEDDFIYQMNRSTVLFCLVGVLAISMGFLEIMCWVLASERQIHRIRLNFFRSVTRQEIGWFDTHETGELATKLSDDINKIRTGIGDKVAMSFQFTATSITGIIIGFVYGPKLAGVIISISPILAILAAFIGKFVTNMTKNELKSYGSAGAIAEEVISSIRTVAAFGGEKKEVIRYSKNLQHAKAYGIKKGISAGVGMGVTFLIIFCTYAFGFWYGTELVFRGEMDIGDVLIVFFDVIIGAFSIGQAMQNLSEFGTARGAAYAVWGILDKIPNIDSFSSEGIKPEITGNIKFENVQFRYPSRPDVQVMKGLNLTVNLGKKVALVGPSGCGKSTCVQLIQRFYDPQEGSIKIDGRDIRDFNVKYLREHIGVVSQEPILFGTTIAENIRYGKLGISDSEIEAAAMKANAHNFIQQLPNGYKTLVGERGAQLSGGQKQRVAIARALVKNPKILLLDEATSALDTESEAVVQAALDKASEGRTTIIVAHRLSTIQNADIIAGFENGRVVEQGTHNELMGKKGVYYQLVSLQSQKKIKDEEEEKSEDEEDDEDVEDVNSKVNFDRSISNEYKRSDSRNSQNLHEKRSLKRTFSSSSKASDTDNNSEIEEVKAENVSMTRILRLNRPEWGYIIAGIIASTANGAVQPGFAILFSQIIGIFAELEQDPTGVEKRVNFICILFAVLGVVAGLAGFFQSAMFAKSGEELTMRLRYRAFEALLRQEIGFFDDKKNSTGTLTTKLATDASAVQGAAGPRIGVVFQSIANLGTGVIIAFVFGWEMTLIVLLFVPFMVLAGMLHMSKLTGFANLDKKALEDSGKVAVECFENMRTVASLTLEDNFNRSYEEHLETPYKEAKKNSIVHGATYGFSQGIIYFVYAAAFRFGAYMVQLDRMEFDDVFLVFSALTFGAMALGQGSSFAPDAAKAKTAAENIFALLDRTPLIDSHGNSGKKLDKSYDSKISFEEVRFSYPTRRDVRVLKGISLSVNPGETAALVGSSGCGKSTCVQLIERFYDPSKGEIKLDDSNLMDLNVEWMRSQVGLVSQEPILFGYSIRENIAYGDNSRKVSMEEIIQAAKEANIHSFIKELPLGYETSVGDKGAQLSGGQKQRVAIARALVRNPKILLLDEATSALDTESEKIVQDALDKASRGRTTIIIAHRLSTVRNADKIVVIKHGKIVEQGKHSELMSKKGAYYKLNSAQMSEI